MAGFTPIDDEPLWGLTVTEPSGPADKVDQLITELLDVQDDICQAVTWLVENWSADLPTLTREVGNRATGCALRLMACVGSRDELDQLAGLLEAPVAPTDVHHDRLWWHAQRSFGTVLLDAFYAEPISPEAAAYVAGYLAKADGPEAGAA